jgi:hypothetical protein
MKSYRHQLLWKTCFQFVSLVRTQQGIDDGQVKKKKKNLVSSSLLGTRTDNFCFDLYYRTDYQFLMSVLIPPWDSQLPNCWLRNHTVYGLLMKEKERLVSYL